MKKIFHIAKANILRHKGAFASLFIIITIVSMLATIGLSVLLGVDKNFSDVIDDTNSFHSSFILTKEKYNPSFEDILTKDSRVSKYEILEVVSPSQVTINYGGESLVKPIIFNMDIPIEISASKVVEEDVSIPREKAIYLTTYAKGLGYKIGDDFTMIYKNKPIHFIVAGFIESDVFSSVNLASTLKFYVPGECYENLKQQFDSSVWISVRLTDINNSQQFNRDFASEIDMEYSDFAFVLDSTIITAAVKTPVSVIAGIIMVFALLIVLISMFVMRSRVMNTIEDTMYEIGVLKASGYKSDQIITCYLVEYGTVSLPAALLGVIISIPVFPAIRQVMISTSGFSWSLGPNIVTGVFAALLVVAVLLAMVLHACRKIKDLPPVTALRGGLGGNPFRRNHFPLHKGSGSVHMRLGLKNMFVFFKTYVMTGIIIAIMSLASVFVLVLYQNIVSDQMALAKMAGIEFADVLVSVTRHTDADALAFEIEKMPEVRKTSMLDNIEFQVDGVEVFASVSSDFGQMEDMFTHDGRFPMYDNEVAIPKLFADQLGKKIGDSVVIKTAGVSQEFVITGFYSVMSNGGHVATITLSGYQQLDPNYKRNSVNIYLDDDVAVGSFIDTLKQSFGVTNVYQRDESGIYANAKVVAEEKISNYIEYYNIDNVEYAVLYNGELILSGSSSAYQIEEIVNVEELAKSQLGTFSVAISLVTQLIVILSLIIITIILSLTVRNIVSKRYRELGTLKALGFTAKQLARQLAISFMPCAAIGVAVGCIFGAIIASPALTSLLASTGAYGAAFAVNPLIVIMVGVLFLLASFIVANISAGSIKNISPYELISERFTVKKKRDRFGLKKKIPLLLLCVMCFSLTTNTTYARDASESVEPFSSPVKSEQLYGIGSVSKVFTAAAVMKLVEDDKVDLDTPITVYIPDFRMADERYEQITPRMLLNHSCGLMGMTGTNSFLLGDNDTYAHDHFLDQLKSQTLKHDPGESSIYCNDAFTLAEILVERVSGVSFTEFIESNFLVPLGLENIKTPQSDFDRSKLAPIYAGNNNLQQENVGMIGSGGIYATMEDLCRFATIFMKSADGAILARSSVDEMEKNQHKNEMVPQEADTVIRYGLGWDSVETYPFSKYGITALSKGGATGKYHTNLTVLPEYNLSAAVSSSGNDSMEQQIAQEIILAVLKEEGLIPDDAYVAMPEQNLERAKIPESYKAYAGIYDTGTTGKWNVDFTEEALVITPIMVQNERPRTYIYNTDGEFVSTNNDYLSASASKEGSRGITALSFADDKYLVMQTYESFTGISTVAYAMPVAEKLEDNAVSSMIWESWKSRNDKEYLLVNEKHSSVQYFTPIVKTLADDRAYGYVGSGIYKGNGQEFKTAKIVDKTTALGFQSVPTMAGRDTNNLYITQQNGTEYLDINNYRFIDAASVKKLSETGDIIVLGSETVWVDIDSDAGGKKLSITTPQNGAWFVYDDKMNCIATSLEAQLRETIILPENGRLAFAGETGVKFTLN